MLTYAYVFMYICMFIIYIIYIYIYIYIYCAMQQEQEQRASAAEAAAPPPATPATRLAPPTAATDAALGAKSRGLKAWGISDLVDRLMLLEGMYLQRLLLVP
jgi:hypothetical protein